jgi:hypothetical protein
MKRRTLQKCPGLDVPWVNLDSEDETLGSEDKGSEDKGSEEEIESWQLRASKVYNATVGVK